ncbi:hypothetical protein [Nitrosovibrio sp. Nv17]|uniref:hypothetical protein n=1 Tax=Nitrosovibrio sp. Nv17 TaxID=1855339 RepID=UPI000908D3CC|nr:hypothetical protein [Nitrosovibrio sp. Nv17]SFW17724.1 hypothetical protein SAMN05216414_10459 [Nitrosovibrio sp. Nv17]
MSQTATPKDISQAKNPDMRASLAAMQRAAESAKQIAIQTNTAIVVVRDGVRMRITAEQLRREHDEQPDTP